MLRKARPEHSLVSDLARYEDYITGSTRTDVAGRSQYTLSLTACSASAANSFGCDLLPDDESNSDEEEEEEEDELVEQANRFFTDGQRKSNPWPNDRKKCMKKHAEFLRDSLYAGTCKELRVKMNSGIRQYLTQFQGADCLCGMDVLNFRDYFIGDRGIPALVPLLRFPRNLKGLSLAGNGLRDAGLRALVDTIMRSTCLLQLLVLDLSNNPIDGPCTERLLHILSPKKKIILLGLWGTDLSHNARQNLLRKSLAKFEDASLEDMVAAQTIAKQGLAFADVETLLLAVDIVEDRISYGKR